MAGAGAVVLLAVSIVIYGVCVIIGVACLVWRKAFSREATGDEHLNIWRRRGAVRRNHQSSIVMDDSGDPITTVSERLSSNCTVVPPPPPYETVMRDGAVHDRQFPPPSYSELCLHTTIDMNKETA